MAVYAKLNEKYLEGLKECEEEMGVILVAYERQVPTADLNSEKLEKIKKLEEEIGIKLVAYE